ncbi:energy transducer TonB [Pedobacter changchengzhani]|nr:energy transducer TonB [Pedobacter changchengzhani]
MNNTQKFKILLMLLFLVTINASAQTRKLIKSFKFGSVGYNLYTIGGRPNTDLADTTFYLLYRVGNTKVLGKEIKEITEKSSGEVQLNTTYEIFPKSIIFKREGFTDDAYRKYMQNSKGLLSFLKYGVPVAMTPPPPPSSGTVITAVDNSGKPDEVDVLPEYPGGINNARKYVGEHVEYPAEALENGIEGTIILTFVIEKDGSVTEIKIDKGLGFGLDEEVMRVMKRMPKWSPAKLNGNDVRYRMRMPVNFQLN